MGAHGEHDNNEQASDVHVIDAESEADGVFQNAIEDVHSLKHTSGCEGDKGVAIDVDDGHTIDTNSDGFVLRRSKNLATTKGIC